MIDLAGLIAAAALLIAFVTLEVRHTGRASVQPAGGRTTTRTRNGKVAVAVLWLLFIGLLAPRVLGLLT